VRIYTPSKAEDLLEEAKKQLYLMKTAILTENEEKLNKRIDSIRKLLVEVGDNL
tara:strand:- start:2159 stop:2320 length:162 start_codon:yes stop_codon:yes gene_type:complete